MDKKKRRKIWKRGKSVLAAVLALLLVTGSLNLPGALEVRAENSSEIFTEGSTETVLEPLTEQKKEAVSEVQTESQPEPQTTTQSEPLTERQSETIGKEELPETTTEKETEEDILIEETESMTSESVMEPVIVTPEFTDGLEAAEIQQEAMSPAEASAKSMKIITAWHWSDSEDELEIQQDEETGAWGLGMPGVTIKQADFDTVVSMLPTAITATITVEDSGIPDDELPEQDSEDITDTEDETDYEETEELSLTWNCETYTKDETGNWPISGDYTFQADLPDGYVLAEDMEKPEVTVQLGEAVPYGGNNAGSYNVTGGTSGEDWVYDSSVNSLTIQKSGTYTVSGDGKETQEKIIVGELLNVTMTLKNIHCVFPYWATMGVYDSAALSVSGSSTVTLILEGENELTGGYNNAGVEFNVTQDNGSLTIQGDGILRASSQNYGAGIGGGYQAAGSNITINGGTVIATSNSGAGIGGGYKDVGSNITINGGTVIASSNYGAGIGSGRYGNGSNITINGGTVTADGGLSIFVDGVGIGNLAEGSDSNIKISGGSVKANSIGTTPKNADGAVYLFKLNSLLGIDSISVDDNSWTRDGNHPDNDDGFYLYLTGENHDIVADGKTYKAIWNADTLSFDNQNAPAPTISETSSTLTTITVKVSEYNSDYGNLQYACIETGSTLKRSDWIDSTDTSYTFNDRSSGTSYTCYVRYAGNDTYYTSDFVSKERRTVPAAPDPSVYRIDYASEYAYYDSNIYEFNTSRDFSGESVSPNWLSDFISDANGTDKKLYMRVKEVWSGGYNTPASEATEITIPKRPQAPEAQVTATANSVTLTQNDAWEYSTDQGGYKNWNNTNEFTEMGQNQTKTCYVRVKATDSSFASAIQTVDATTSAADYTISIPPTVKAGSEAVNIAVNTDKKFDLGNNGHVDVKAVSSDSFTGGILTMKYTGNEENIPNITSQMKVKDSLFTDLSKNIASFRTKDDAAVKIEFEKPKPTQGSIIRAGEYSGTVTFTIEYSEGQ